MPLKALKVKDEKKLGVLEYWILKCFQQTNKLWLWTKDGNTATSDRAAEWRPRARAEGVLFKIIVSPGPAIMYARVSTGKAVNSQPCNVKYRY